MNFEKTIADGYATYTDDELGYRFNAWDITSIEAIRLHDSIIHSDAEALQTMNTSMFDDLQRWAFARACRKHNLTEQFFMICEQLTGSESEHPALNYPEILETYAVELARADRLEQAQSLVQNAPSHSTPLDLPGRLALLANNEHAAREIFETLAAEHPDDAELRFDIAEDFAQQGFSASATEWLQHAQQVAQRCGDQALLVDIELLRLDILEITAK